MRTLFLRPFLAGIALACLLFSSCKEVPVDYGKGAQALGSDWQNYAARILRGAPDYFSAVLPISKGSVEGIFSGTQWLDGMFLSLLDQQGDMRSFFCLSSACDRFDANPSLFGQRVRINWQQSERYVAGVDSRVPVYEVVSIDLLESWPLT